EDIIHRSVLKGSVNLRSSVKKWKTTVLFTLNGFYYRMPEFRKKGNPEVKLYTPWENVYGVDLSRDKGLKLTKNIYLSLERDKLVDTKKIFWVHAKKFFLKFLPLIIEKKEEWLKQNQDNPEIKKGIKRFMDKTLTNFKREYEKILSK
ncbi:hypothetical protein LCGC14_2014430, partial [marine sediment metagenome]